MQKAKWVCYRSSSRAQVELWKELRLADLCYTTLRVRAMYFNNIGTWHMYKRCSRYSIRDIVATDTKQLNGHCQDK